jgi:hypothetical protein
MTAFSRSTGVILRGAQIMFHAMQAISGREKQKASRDFQITVWLFS